MAKSETQTNNTIQILLLVVLALLVGYLLSGGKPVKMPAKDTTAPETITNPSGLDQAQDQLDSVNVDAMDSGLNQLNSEVSRY